MRISRGCYDKYHRCPGSNGGGFKYAKVQHCIGGYINYNERKLGNWRFSRCNKCDVLVLPKMSQWLDPTWLKYIIGRRYKNWRYERGLKIND